jgi:hypothetical protein
MQKPATKTRYYLWEGDACRVHKDADGNETADTYRAGNVYVPLSAADVIWNGVEIEKPPIGAGERGRSPAKIPETRRSLTKAHSLKWRPYSPLRRRAVT